MPLPPNEGLKKGSAARGGLGGLHFILCPLGQVRMTRCGMDQQKGELTL